MECDTSFNIVSGLCYVSIASRYRIHDFIRHVSKSGCWNVQLRKGVPVSQTRGSSILEARGVLCSALQERDVCLQSPMRRTCSTKIHGYRRCAFLQANPTIKGFVLHALVCCFPSSWSTAWLSDLNLVDRRYCLGTVAHIYLSIMDVTTSHHISTWQLLQSICGCEYLQHTRR